MIFKTLATVTVSLLSGLTASVQAVDALSQHVTNGYDEVLKSLDCLKIIETNKDCRKSKWGTTEMNRFPDSLTDNVS